MEGGNQKKIQAWLEEYDGGLRPAVDVMMMMMIAIAMRKLRDFRTIYSDYIGAVTCIQDLFINTSKRIVRLRSAQRPNETDSANSPFFVSRRRTSISVK